MKKFGLQRPKRPNKANPLAVLPFAPIPNHLENVSYITQYHFWSIFSKVHLLTKSTRFSQSPCVCISQLFQKQRSNILVPNQSWANSASLSYYTIFHLFSSDAGKFSSKFCGKNMDFQQIIQHDTKNMTLLLIFFHAK